MILLKVPELPQWSPTANRFRTDCGPAAVGMVLAFYGRLNGLTVDQLAAETTLVQADVGLQPSALVTLAALHGLTLTVHWETTLDDLRTQLDAGKPIIALIAYRWITGKLDKNDNGPNDGHFFVVVGYDGDNFYVCDSDYWQPYTARGLDVVVPASEMDAAIGGGSRNRQSLFVMENKPMDDLALWTSLRADAAKFLAIIDGKLASLPPPDPVPLPPGARTMVVSTDKLNVRFAPTSTSVITGILLTGQVVHIVDDVTADNHPWGKLLDTQFAGGYVAEDFLSVPQV